MLLNRLAEYAERAADDLPADYYRAKQIHWVLEITEDGEFAEVRDARVPARQRADAVVEQVPHVQRSGTKVPPYLLVDTAEFVLGLPKADKSGGVSDRARDEAARRHRAYRELALRWADTAPDDPAAGALRTILNSGAVTRLVPEDADAKDTVAVRVGNRWLHATASVQRLWAEVVRERKGGAQTRTGLCLVCGEHRDLLDTIPEPVKKGAIPTSGGSNEGQLVSINTTAQGRDGITQLTNTPICHRCGGRAMAALNHLLASEKHSRRFRDDGALVWWTKKGTDDDLLTMFFDDRPDPARIAHLFDTLHSAPSPLAGEAADADSFHSVTLGLNNARLVVRDWLDVPLPEVKRAVADWYEDHGVYDGWRDEKRYLPIWQLAQSCGRWAGERYAKNSAPIGIDAELLRAALGRAPIPHRLLPLVLQRIHADGRVDPPRVALLRLILTRSNDPKDHVMAKLDEDSTDPPYVAGRIFAVLEEIQRRALPDLNTTLRDKHFATAATAPSALLGHLRFNANAHLRRLRRDRPGAGVRLDKRLHQLSGKITEELPRHLTPREQARFVIGYDHERAASLAKASAAKAARDQGGGYETDSSDDSH